MKRILTGALALTLLAGTAASAQPYGGHDRNDHRDGRYEQNRYDNDRNGRDQRDRYDNDRRDSRYGDNRGQRAHRWSRGQRLPAMYRTRGHYVDYRSHRLRQPPRGYQWVQVNDDYLMVALTTGLIAQMIAR